MIITIAITIITIAITIITIAITITIIQYAPIHIHGTLYPK